MDKYHKGEGKAEKKDERKLQHGGEGKEHRGEAHVMGEGSPGQGVGCLASGPSCEPSSPA